MSGDLARRPPSSAGRTLDLELRRWHNDDRAERRFWRLGLLVASLLHVAALAVPVPIASDEPAAISRCPPLVCRLQSVKFKLPSPRRIPIAPRVIGCASPPHSTGPRDGPGVSPNEPGFVEWHPGVARAGIDVPVPEVLVRVDPVYPEPARRARLQGTAVVELLLGLEGEVADMTVLRGLPMGLTESALDAVRQWRFAPSTIDGRAVRVRYVISVHFRLR